FGERRWARGLKPHHAEALVKGSVLNRMPQLGMPETVRVEYSPSFEEGSIGAVLHCPTKPLTKVYIIILCFFLRRVPITFRCSGLPYVPLSKKVRGWGVIGGGGFYWGGVSPLPLCRG